MKSVICFVMVIIFSTISLLGCSHKVDEYFIGSEACNPPCVLGIQPGVTEKIDAIQLLQKYETNKEGVLTILDSGIIRWRASNTNYYFYSDDSHINQVSLRPRSTTLQDIINLFGEPSNLSLGKLRDGYYSIDLFYPEKGLFFGVVSRNNKEGFVIEPNMPVVKADFLEPSDITSMINSLYGKYGKNYIDETLANTQAWNGYGNFFP